MERSKKRKAERRKKAEELKKERAKRSPEEQLAKLDREGWRATKERAKLKKMIGKKDKK